MTKPTEAPDQQRLSDEELIERAKADPGVQARAEALVAEVKAGAAGDRPGIRGRELSDFLRELRGNVEH